MDEAIQRLLSTYPLPAGTAAPELFTDRLQIGELELGLVGLVADVGGTKVVGSAADLGELPYERAYFELVERVSLVWAMQARSQRRALQLLAPSGELLQALDLDEVFPPSPNPDAWRLARSNGVATGPTYGEARARAWAEAVERDAVLKSWYGDLRLEPLPSSAASLWSPVQSLYDLELRCVRWADHWVVVAVGFPRTIETPRCLGLGARPDLEPANHAAFREFTQRLGFLWGEEIPNAQPEPTPTADYHQELYLWAGSESWLRRWLGPERATRPASEWAPLAAPRGFIELTPPELVGKLSIVKAYQPELWPLPFGAGFEAPGKDQPGSSEPPHAIHPIA